MAISFDGVAKHITLSLGTTELNVKDLWSRWVDWVLTGDNSKYLPAMTQVGGNDIDLASGTSIPVYIYLLNGWRVIPQSADHTLNVVQGILLVEGGGDPFDHTGSYVIRINYQQPVQAITVSTGGNFSSTDRQVLELLLKLLKNKQILDPSTGNRVIYDDDSVTPLLEALTYKDVAGTQPYDGTGPVHRSEKMT